MKRSTVLALGILFCTSSCGQAGEQQFVFMGDSLVDNHNSFLFTSRLNAEGALKSDLRDMVIQQAGSRGGDTFKGSFWASSIKQAAVERSVIQRTAIPMSPPYFEGRFSNGINWADKLAPTQLYYADYYLSDDNCTLENPVIGGSGICSSDYDPGPQPGANLSFAFGGSRSGNEGLLEPGGPGFLKVLSDLENYVQSDRIPYLTGSVFGVWTGGNDYSAYAINSEGLAVEEAVDKVLDNIESGLVRISALGAKRVIVLNIFPLDKIPALITGLGKERVAIAQQAADLHNKKLPVRLDSARAVTGMDIVLVNVDGLYRNILASPSSYGFTNLTEGCVTDDGTGAPTGACPTEIEERATLYWDGIHPTTAAHDYIHELVELER